MTDVRTLNRSNIAEVNPMRWQVFRKGGAIFQLWINKDTPVVSYMKPKPKILQRIEDFHVNTCVASTQTFLRIKTKRSDKEQFVHTSKNCWSSTNVPNSATHLLEVNSTLS
jgi:hypothetical protein